MLLSIISDTFIGIVLSNLPYIIEIEKFIDSIDYLKYFKNIILNFFCNF